MRFLLVSIAICATFMASTAFAGKSDLELSQKLIGVWSSEDKIADMVFYREAIFRNDGTASLIYERCIDDYGCKSASFETIWEIKSKCICYKVISKKTDELWTSDPSVELIMDLSESHLVTALDDGQPNYRKKELKSKFSNN